jgi:hypothetical protein
MSAVQLECFVLFQLDHDNLRFALGKFRSTFDSDRAGAQVYERDLPVTSCVNSSSRWELNRTLSSILRATRVIVVHTRPCCFAALAIAPLLASTSSPYRIGMRVDFHRPACITDPRSIFSANKSCAASTRTEAPLIWLTCFAGIPIHRAALLYISATMSACSLSPTLPLPTNPPKHRPPANPRVVQPNLEPFDCLAGEIRPTPLPRLIGL